MTLLIDFTVIVILLIGIRQFRSPRGAKYGNLTAALAMFLAFILVLYRNGIIDTGTFVVSLLVGAIAGFALARAVNMIQVPAMVAFQHGAGGIAAVLVSLLELTRTTHSLTMVSEISGLLGLVIGSLTFSGSMIASAKLANRMPQAPQVLNQHNFLVLANIAAVVVIGSLTFFMPTGTATFLYVIEIILGAGFGILLAIRIGGADMPVLISSLNATAGLAAALCGMVIESQLLIAFGATVAASGSILTYVMCKAMNRGIVKVIFPEYKYRKKAAVKAQETSLACNFDSQPGSSSADNSLYNKENTILLTGDAKTTVHRLLELPAEESPPIDTAADMSTSDAVAAAVKSLLAAQSVIVIPGYGMALAKAQFKLVELVSLLEQKGANVKYAIHPVAGRMPGHMNVLLAEADVDYDNLLEMDEANLLIRKTDVAIVMGACDVVNPAAIASEGTPISGMPILLAQEAKQVIVCNFDKNPGYSGVPNPLYDNSKTILLLGDARETTSGLLAALQAVEV